MAPVSARVSMIVNASAKDIFSAFVTPDKLTAFWLSSSSGTLEVGKLVHWQFMAPGTEIDTTAIKLETGRAISWNWLDGSTVAIDFEELKVGTAVTIVIDGFPGSEPEKVEAD